MTDTRAVANLPGLAIELRHRAAPEEGAEYLSITMRATPGFEAVALWLDPYRMARAWLMLNPFTAWMAVPPVERALHSRAHPPRI